MQKLTKTYPAPAILDSSKATEELNALKNQGRQRRDRPKLQQRHLRRQNSKRPTQSRSKQQMCIL